MDKEIAFAHIYSKPITGFIPSDWGRIPEPVQACSAVDDGLEHRPCRGRNATSSSFKFSNERLRGFDFIGLDVDSGPSNGRRACDQI